MPATLEVVHCWAMGNRSSGTAIQTTPRTAMRGQSSRSTRARALEKRASVAAPRPIRASVMTPGSNDRRPISMNRKDEPQMSAMAESSPQSKSV